MVFNLSYTPLLKLIITIHPYQLQPFVTTVSPGLKSEYMLKFENAPSLREYIPFSSRAVKHYLTEV